MSEDPNNNPITDNTKRKSITEDPKENSMTKDPQELKDPRRILLYKKSVWLFGESI